MITHRFNSSSPGDHNTTAGLLHLRFQGLSHTVPLRTLGLEPGAKTDTIRAAAARFLKIHPATLAHYVVDTTPDGNVVVRPQAVFG